MSRAAWLRTLVAALALLLLVPTTALAAPNSPTRVYFPQTQHYLAYGFLDYWLQHGGLAIFGYPITEEFQQNGLTVQYFERAVFEYHPSNPNPYKVEQRRLGANLTAGRQSEAPFQPLPATTNSDGNCAFYAATGHRLCFGFQAYWQQHGGLPVFGYPISEEFQENGYTVQYFERARFEYHPSNPPAWQVELGLLGDQAAQQDGVSTAPLAASASVPTYDPSLWSTCQPAQLRAGVGSSNGATGHILTVFTLMNTSTATCTLYGYPGMQLLDGSGNPLPTTVHRGGAGSPFALLDDPAQLVYLAPGDSASFDVGFAHIPSGAYPNCPVSAQLEITPPNDYSQLTIPAMIDACGGQLYTSPVVWGTQGVPD
ncbi:MAG TPA: DUF4232 domain-containing protein [Thermomicrobiaceae bacterium]|nr:DUF4232 domain-containing protein [Thermomicrobiaceae bacterium]